MNRTATVIGKIVKVDFPPEAGGGSALFPEIAIDCPDCGQGTIRLPGHHLRAIRDLLIAWCDEYPALVGGEVQQVGEQRLNFGGPGSDPSTN